MQLDFPLKSTFLALPLEQEAKWQFQAIQEELKDFDDCLNFQNPQTPHITLQFWKEVMEIEYNQILEQSKKLADDTGQFILKTEGIDTFGSRGEDRVLFFPISFSEELARLRKACPWPTDKPFHPHCTIARIRHPQRFAAKKKKILKVLEDCMLEIPVKGLRLYAQVEGVNQTPLVDFHLS